MAASTDGSAERAREKATWHWLPRAASHALEAEDKRDTCSQMSPTPVTFRHECEAGADRCVGSWANRRSTSTSLSQVS
jgi:hypothetical protein